MQLNWQVGCPFILSVHASKKSVDRRSGLLQEIKFILLHLFKRKNILDEIPVLKTEERLITSNYNEEIYFARIAIRSPGFLPSTDFRRTLMWKEVELLHTNVWRDFTPLVYISSIPSNANN